MAPHSTAEVDCCESLFSESGALALIAKSQPHQGWDVWASHFGKAPPGTNLLQQGQSLEGFVRRWKENDWRHSDDRDDLDFWKQEKESFLNDLPQHKGIFDGLDSDDEEDSDEESWVEVPETCVNG